MQARSPFAATLLCVLIFLGRPNGLAGGEGTPLSKLPQGLRARPLSAATNSTPRLFESLPPQVTGIDFVYQWNPAPQYERLLNSSAVGGGVGVGDYDGDGWPDLCLTRPAGGYRLYRNLGDFHFTNVTERAGLRDEAVWSTGATFADIDNDGQLDLFICCYDSPNRLYLNQGNGTFVERAQAFGLDFNGASIMMAFGDYDRDGRLDAYLLTGGLPPKPSQRFRVKFVDGRPTVPEELREVWQLIYQPGDRAALAEAGQLDHLYHNNGDGTFSDVSQAAGIMGCDFGNAVIWWDYDHDGWPDLYVANDYFGPDRLYRNNHNGTFTDAAKTALPHTPWTSMGADIADINNDGLMDLIASDMSGTTRYKRLIDSGDIEKSGWFLDLPEPRQYMRNALYLNTGLDRFVEAAYLTGLAHTDWTWSILFGDLDNDGWVDVFVPNGMTRDWMDNDLALKTQGMSPADLARFWRDQPVRGDQNLAFKNLGTLQFKETAKEWGLDHPGPSFGAALADLDGDGNLDLIVNDFQAPARLYRNCSVNSHRMEVRLLGATSNRYGVGATVRIETPAGPQTRYVTLAHGFMSASEPLAHFGLGPFTQTDLLVVEWPSGATQSFANLPADQLFTVAEAPASASQPRNASPASTLFVRSSSFTGITHEAEPFDDFQRQPLLPYKVSQLGPGLAWSELDDAGTKAFYLSGTSRKPGELYRQDGSGQFQRAFRGLAPAGEEMAPLFFDANGDGFPDLFVAVSGAAGEREEGGPRPRLYLNDGQGRFAPAPPGTLPELRDSGSTVVAADFDQDGDLDLFVGGRLIPGRYPLTPDSHLLRNDGGRFTEVTDELAPGLRHAGMVTSALWSDADNDGWVDLLVTCEWGPVRLFHNQRGRLVERTREAGLASRLGWWNGIAAGDLDNDGDMDYVVTNLGLNTAYQPTPEEPNLIYYGDFDTSGHAQIIEAVMTGAGPLPLRGRSVLAKAIPSLGDKFPTHHSFASASLADLLGTQSLDAAAKLVANTAESGILMNDGNGRFTFRPLPRLAQIAPSFGVVVADVDGDGNPDLFLVQNFFSPHREAGRMDGGVGLLLLGRGDGAFEPVWPDRSGLLVPGDAKSLVTADLNGDGWLDFLVGVNNGELLAFENHGSSSNRLLTVRLQGRAGNPTAVGARVTAHLRGGARRTAEISAGGGYLSQSASTLAFGLGTTGEVARLEIHWPDGRVTDREAGAAASPTGPTKRNVTLRIAP